MKRKTANKADLERRLAEYLAAEDPFPYANKFEIKLRGIRARFTYKTALIAMCNDFGIDTNK